jgi:hypothetical protein
MSMTILVGVAAGFVGIILGYFLARLDAIYTLLRGQSNSAPSQPQSFFAKQKRDQAEVEERMGKISIDERKFVADIKTDNIKKVTEVELGKKTQQQDNINQSVSRLAQLKGKEG